MSQPGFFFYTGDYLKDTRVLSAEQRGCWMDALCFLNEHGGSVTWPISAYAQFWGVSDDTARCVLDAIAMANVGNVQWQSDSKTVATLSNRRILREIEKRNKTKRVRSEAGKKGAANRWQKCGSSESSPSPSPSPSSYKEHEAAPAAPPKKEEKKPEPAPEPPLPKNATQQLAALAAEIGKLDPTDPRRTAQLLCQWALSMTRVMRKEPVVRTHAVVVASLEAFRAKIKSGYEIKNAWGLLDTIFNKERTRYMQEVEPAQHKKPIGLESVAQIFDGMRAAK